MQRLFQIAIGIRQWTPYIYTQNDNLAAIFDVKLKVTIDNQEPQKSPIFQRSFQSRIALF